MKDSISIISTVVVDSVKALVMLGDKTVMQLDSLFKDEPSAWTPSIIVAIVVAIVSAIVSFILNKRTLSNANKLFDRQTNFSFYTQWSNDLRRYSAIYFAALQQYIDDSGRYHSMSSKLNELNKDKESKNPLVNRLTIDEKTNRIEWKTPEGEVQINLRESVDRLRNAEYNLLLLLDSDSVELKNKIKNFRGTWVDYRQYMSNQQIEEFIDEYSDLLNSTIVSYKNSLLKK